MSSGISFHLVVGLGNDQRGDDGVGLLAVRRLGARRLPGIAVRECRGDATALIDWWSGARQVWLVDAVSSGARPGRVFRFDATDGISADLRSRFSTHGLGISETIALAQRLNRMPQRLIVYGVEGANFELGAAPSSAAKRGAARVIKAIVRELQDGSRED